MARKLFGAAFLLIVVTSTGCLHGAREVSWDAKSGSGVVAIPENSDMWPTNYRTDAFKMIQQRYPNFNPMTDIVSEHEQIVGQQTQNSERVENRKIGPDGKPIGNLTTGSTTSTTSDLKEYWIEYRIRATPMGGQRNDILIPAGGIPKSGAGLGPTGKPLNEQPVVNPRTGQPVSQFNNFGTK